MALFATPDDLLFWKSEDILAQLADDTNSPADYNALNTQAVLAELLTRMSNRVRRKLFGRVDIEDTQVLADAKHMTTVLTMEALYARRGSFGTANPFYAMAQDVREDLNEIRTGKQTTGLTEDNPSLAGALTDDLNKDPEYSVNEETGRKPFIDRF